MWSSLIRHTGSQAAVTVQSSRITSVDKGEWDRSMGFEKDLE
jgi:hypothetical protein